MDYTIGFFEISKEESRLQYICLIIVLIVFGGLCKWLSFFSNADSNALFLLLGKLSAFNTIFYFLSLFARLFLLGCFCHHLHVMGPWARFLVFTLMIVMSVRYAIGMIIEYGGISFCNIFLYVFFRRVYFLFRFFMFLLSGGGVSNFRSRI